MTTLENIDKLKDLLIDFKNDYLLKFKESITNEFNDIISKYPDINNVHKQIEKEHNLKTSIYSTRKYYLVAENIMNILRLNHYNKLDQKINDEINKASKNFDSKTVKLYNRLVKKGISEVKNININYTYPDLEGHIESDNKKVSFYTILAYGEIQRPHYRYLIK